MKKGLKCLDKHAAEKNKHESPFDTFPINVKQYSPRARYSSPACVVYLGFTVVFIIFTVAHMRAPGKTIVVLCAHQSLSKARLSPTAGPAEQV